MSTVQVSVATAKGKVRGFQEDTAWGKRFFSFLGIPYAKPPVGPLRFKPPQPADPWDGVLECSKEANAAPQFHMLTGDYIGDEDCLYLNVYTPHVAHCRPVMVWIHGGGFCSGSSSRDLYGPEYLMQRDIVLVSINYRLGALGFMSTGDKVVSGNMGLKDQVMALRWVKDNIALFGGDPNNVTIFGESAGSISCHLLMLSPMAKGLFHRVICQSGVAFHGMLSQPIRDKTFRMATHLGLKPGASSEELLDFMRGVPASKIVHGHTYARSKQDIDRLFNYPFFPMIEQPNSADEPFITEDPHDILKRGDFNRVPIIMGVTSNEGLFFVNAFRSDEDAIKDIDANFSRMVPENLPVKEGQRKAVGQKIKDFYFKGKPVGADTEQQYSEFWGEHYFVYPSVEAAEVQSSLPEAQPVFFYQFDVVARNNFVKKTLRVEQFPGASHCDDLCYLFRMHMMKPELEPGSLEEKVVLQMTKLWTNFAKTGNPTAESAAADALADITWKPFSSADPVYLHVSNSGLGLDRGLMKDRVDFWKQMYRQA